MERMDDAAREPRQDVKLKTQSVNLYYGGFHALGDITFDIPARAITAIIGPSGCGKSTLLRIFNRMNDLIPGCRVEGQVFLDDASIYKKDTDVVSLRKKVGMVFQKPNLFPMSIYDNAVIGPRRHGVKNKRSLSQVALWDEVRDILDKPGLSLATGQQQRLCIARALAIEPEVILMDESCSALDPESTLKIEELMMDLSEKYTIIIVTHNMEQAARVSDMAAFMMIDNSEGDNSGKRVGRLHQYLPTSKMFLNPGDPLTEDYITGRFG